MGSVDLDLECCSTLDTDGLHSTNCLESGLPKGWKMDCCSRCRFGVRRWHYDDGPEECEYCGGRGYVYVTPKGRRVLYPGGPFCGG